MLPLPLALKKYDLYNCLICSKVEVEAPLMGMPFLRDSSGIRHNPKLGSLFSVESSGAIRTAVCSSLTCTALSSLQRQSLHVLRYACSVLLIRLGLGRPHVPVDAPGP